MFGNILFLAIRTCWTVEKKKKWWDNSKVVKLLEYLTMKDSTPTRAKYLLPYRRQWKEIFRIKKLSKVAQRRLRWIDHYAAKRNASLTCRHFDISRSKFYYWLNRFDSQNLSSLEDQSRKPQNVREPEVSEELKLEVIELRSRFKGWGKVKIQQILINRGKYLGRNSIQKTLCETLNIREVLI